MASGRPRPGPTSASADRLPRGAAAACERGATPARRPGGRRGRVRTRRPWALVLAVAAVLLGPGAGSVLAAEDAPTRTPTLKEVLGAEAGTGAEAAEASKGKGKESAHEAPAKPEAAAAPPGATPRSAVNAFLDATRNGDYGAATRYLDLRNLSGAARQEDPETLARQLGTVLSQTWWVDPDSLSGDPEGRRDDGLAPNREEVHRIEMDGGEIPILLQRGRVDGELIWRFASPTLSRVPAMYEHFGYGPMAEYLPQWFFEWQLFGLQFWQWIGLFTLLVTAGFVAWIAASAGHSVARVLLRRVDEGTRDRLTALVAGPLRLVIAVLVFSGGKYLLNPSVVMLAVLSALEQVALVIAITWTFLRLVDVGIELVRGRLEQNGQSQAIQLLPPGRKTLKALILVMAVLVAMDNFGFNVTALLAGLGVGGIAVALAAQKTVENLFGGVTLYADRPVRVGDFCRFGDKIGTVEEIGLRSTRVRTLDRTVISVPNAEFANLQLENFAKRDRIWYHPTIGLRYETTPDQLRYVLVEIRRMLYAHPKVDPDPARIRFESFGAYSLNLGIFAYVNVTDFGEYLEVAEDLNLRIMDIVEKAGTGFAFPSQTTYIEQGEPLSDETQEEIAERVAKWREENALYLPRFPKDAIEELRNTLDYPVEGAPKLNGSGEREGAR